MAVVLAVTVVYTNHVGDGNGCSHVAPGCK